MPLYNFICYSCKNKFEKIVKTSDEEVRCNCGSLAQKLFPNTMNFILKGTCWEKDGYSKENKNAKS